MSTLHVSLMLAGAIIGILALMFFAWRKGFKHGYILGGMAAKEELDQYKAVLNAAGLRLRNEIPIARNEDGAPQSWTGLDHPITILRPPGVVPRWDEYQDTS